MSDLEKLLKAVENARKSQETLLTNIQSFSLIQTKYPRNETVRNYLNAVPIMYKIQGKIINKLEKLAHQQPLDIESITHCLMEHADNLNEAVAIGEETLRSIDR